MKVASFAATGEVIVEVVLFAGAFADVANVAVRIYRVNESEPCFTSGWTVGFGIKPAVFDAGNHCKSEHAGAGSFGPAFRVVDELMP